MKTILTCALLLFGLPASAQLTIPKAAFQNARVVLLGEPTHGEGNVFQHKLELVRYLHDSLGYNILAFESGFYDLYRAEQTLAGLPAGSPSKEVLQDALFPIWTEATDFQSLFPYLESLRGSLKVAGFDAQLTGPASQTYLIDSALALLKKYGLRDTANINAELLTGITEAFGEEFAFPEEVPYGAFRKGVSRLHKALQEIAAQKNLSPAQKTRVEWYVQSIASLAALGADYWSKRGRVLTEETFKAPDSNPRDSMMAQNLLALMRLYPGEKIMCWGAQPHFMGSTKTVENGELQGYRSMGAHLKKALGEAAVFNLAFTSDSGTHGLYFEAPKPVPPAEKGSIEALLKPAGRDTFVLLKTGPFGGQKAISSAIEYTPLRADWSAVFDAFVYLTHFTPSTLFVEGAVPSQPLAGNTAEEVLPAKQAGFAGLVTDAKTGEPVAFAGLYCAAKNWSTQSGSEGHFYIPDSLSGGTFQVQLLGYAGQTARLEKGKENRIKLQPLGIALNEVTVRSKNALTGEGIFKKVLQNKAQNYGTEVCRQRTYHRIASAANDTAFFEREFVTDFYIGLRLRNKPKWNYLESRTILLNQKVYDKALGAVIYGRVADFVRTAGIFEGRHYRGFSFTLVRTYEDEKWGTVYELSFEAKQKRGSYTGHNHTAAYTGSLLVRKKDYAILKATFNLVRDVSKMQKYALRAEGKKDFYAKALSSVYPLSESMTGEIYYAQEGTAGKYYMRSAAFKHRKEGYFMVDKQPVNLLTTDSYFGLEAGVPIENPAQLPFETFRYYPQQVPYNEAFWKGFQVPAE